MQSHSGKGTMLKSLQADAADDGQIGTRLQRGARREAGARQSRRRLTTGPTLVLRGTLPKSMPVR